MCMLRFLSLLGVCVVLGLSMLMSVLRIVGFIVR